MRKIAAAVAVASLVLAGSLPASAQDSLTAGEVDSRAFPAVEIVVTLPGAVDTTVTNDSFTVTDSSGVIVPQVVPLTSSLLDVVLAIDTSGSMSGNSLDAAKFSALVFIAQLPATARIAVVGFGPTAVVATELTGDREVLAEAVSGLTAGGDTALYDALVVAADQVDGDADSRTVLVLLSDGGDTVSTATLEEASATANSKFDVVHAIALASSEQDSVVLESIATVGDVVRAEDPVALASVYEDVANQILNQYLLRWESTLSVDHDIVVAFDDGSRVFSAERGVAVADDAVAAPPTSEPVDESAQLKLTPSADAVLVSVPPPDTIADWVLISGLSLVALSLFVAGFVAFGPKERTRSLGSDFRSRLQRGHDLSSTGRRLVDAVEGFLRRDPDRQVGLARRLEKAGLDISPAEVVTIFAAGSAVLVLLGFGVFGLRGMLGFPFLGILLGLAWIDSKGQKRTTEFTRQLDGTLQLLAGSLRAGFGIMQALRTAAEEGEWPTSDEFARVLGETRLGRDLGDALEASAERIGSDDYSWAVQAIQISREVGGNLAEVLDNVSKTIRQRNTLRREVHSLSAEGRASAVILFALPFLMLGWMSLSNSEYIGLLFNRSGGQMALAVGVGLMTVGAIWMRKIVNIEF